MKRNYNILVVSLVMVFSTFAQSPIHPYKPQGEMKWWNNEIFYEIFVRSFKDSDGDGIGDLKGLTQKLDYLQDLGITAIWLMPINPSPSYHGYDVIDYKAINPDYGTMADFDNFMKEAHQRNLKVIIDLVPNHTSNYHPWFIESMMSKKTPKRNYYLWRDNIPNDFKPVLDPKPWHKTDHGYYYGVFYMGMPDVNHQNPEVQKDFKDIMSFWLKEKNVDGYRVDAVRYLVEQDQFKILEDGDSTIFRFSDYRNFMKSLDLKREPFWVGEAYANAEKIKKYVNGNAFDFCFEFEVAESIIKSLEQNNPAMLYKIMDYVTINYDKFNQYGIFLSNHDQNRIFSMLHEDMPKMKLAATLLLTFPGIPFLYYGEEIGMSGEKPDELLRTPMAWTNAQYGDFSTVQPWLALQQDYTKYNVADESLDTNSLLNHYKKLIAIRKQYPVFATGNYQAMNVSDTNVYAYMRASVKGENALVVHNFSENSLTKIVCNTNKSLLPAGKYKATLVLGNVSIPQTISVGRDGKLSVSIPQLAPMESTIIVIKK